MNDEGHEDGDQQCPEQGDDRPGFEVEEVLDVVIVLHKEGAVTP